MLKLNPNKRNNIQKRIGLYILLPILTLVSLFFLHQKYQLKSSQPAINEYLKVNPEDNTLNILTLNTGLLTYSFFGKTILEPAPFIQERLNAIIEHLVSSNVDIIALQEIYHIEHKQKVISGLSKLYPFSFYYQRQNKFDISLANGELILSRYPIENPEFILFKDNLVTELIAADKGVIIADIKVNDKVFSIANTHLTSGGFIWYSESRESNEIRSKQISEAIKNLKKRKDNDILILLGDFNAGPNVSQVNYDQIINNGFLDTFSLGCKNSDLYSKVTWDPNNSLNAGGVFSDSPPQRIDHIFISSNNFTSIDVVSSSIVFEELSVDTGYKKVTISDHYGLKTKIRFQ